MPIHHRSTILCEKVIQDTRGEFSFIGAFTNIVSNHGFPAVKSPMVVSVELQGAPGDKFSVTLEGPSSVELARGVVEPSGRADHASQQRPIRAVCVLEPVVFESEGVYAVVLWSNGNAVHRYQFGVYSGSEMERAADEDTLAKAASHE